MTPEKRLNQIEPILADVAQKIDRLIESNGLIAAEVSKIPALERSVAITAKGLVDLTRTVDKRLSQVNQRLDGMSQRFEGMEQHFGVIDQRFEGMGQQLDEVRQDMSEIKQTISVLETGQQLIIQILRDRSAQATALCY